MAATFARDKQEKLFERVVAELVGLGYEDRFLQRRYEFEDWFSSRSGTDSKRVVADAVAFGRQPFAHDTACFSLALSGPSAGKQLISPFRSLGTPLAFEIEEDRAILWQVRADRSAAVKIRTIPARDLVGVFRENLGQWNPAGMLRAKNIQPQRPKVRQLDFIDAGLMPALEGHVREKLDPLLRGAFFTALDTYAKQGTPGFDPGKLFRLVFRVLAGKVMTDRRDPNFARFINNPDPDALLNAVNDFFGDKPKLLVDAATRRAVVEKMWTAFDLSNVSASVLSLIWENTLVDDGVREKLGLYGTPPAIARHLAERIGFDTVPESERFVVELCCGSAVFLLAAMRQLTDLLPPKYDARRRHSYLQQMLSGFDVDPFGIEVARDCLMLADYPNQNGWTLGEVNVFEPFSVHSSLPQKTFLECLRRARFVFCNPPFTPNFTTEEMEAYKADSAHKPVELLLRVLDTATELAGIGFVLPHQLLTGQSYRVVRERLAGRFESLDILNLPESGVFSTVRYRAAAIVATKPKSASSAVAIKTRSLTQHGWKNYLRKQELPPFDEMRLSVADASEGMANPELREVWNALKSYPTLSTAVMPYDRRGIQWNKPLEANREKLIRDIEQEGYVPGIPSAPKGTFFCYLSPPTKYLSIKPEDRYRNAYDLPWHLPKVVMNSNRKGSVHPWRIAAFADRSGLVPFHTYKGFWPANEWSPECLAAVLNGPVANAFVTTHETGPEITNEVLDTLPVPRMTSQLRWAIESRVQEYTEALRFVRLPTTAKMPDIQHLLFQIDAIVLKGYGLPPRLERKLLDYFDGFGGYRPVGYPTEDYFPQSQTSYIPLHVYLSNKYRTGTVEKSIRELPNITDPNLVEALEEIG